MIWLLRHGDAEHGSPDEQRPLTDKGRRQAAAAGHALGRLGVELHACLASPRVRALDTARIACETLGLEPEVERRLAGGAFDPGDLAAGRGEVLLVGHEPDLSDAIARLTGARADMKKGGLAGLEGSELRVLLRPRELKAIAGH